MPDHLLDSTPAEMDIWSQRLQKIMNVLEVVRDRPEKEPNDRNKTIDYLLNQLKNFGQKQFNFFHQGFQHGPRLHLAVDPASPQQVSSQYVFGMILNQIANDLVVLQRAQEQRQTAVKNQNAFIAATLQMADQIAYRALQKLAIYLPDEPENTTLCYLHLSASSRVVPYAPVALIGIPMSCVGETIDQFGVSRDLLAIPHELGHYLYWHGKLHIPLREDGPTSLRANIKENLATGQNTISSIAAGVEPIVATHAWLHNWSEEIFADIVSCLLAGPIAALYFQDLLLQIRNDWMMVDDGTYPIAALRPYIFSETFRHLGLTAIADQLQQRWEQKLQVRQLVLNHFYPYVNPASDKLPQHLDAAHQLLISPVQEPRAIVQQAVSEITNLLRNIYDAQQGSNDSWFLALDGLNLADENDVKRAYEQFGVHVKRMTETQHPLDQTWSEITWVELIKARCLDEDILSNPSLPAYVDWVKGLEDWANDRPVSSPFHLPHAIWRPILEFAGWTNEGPTDGNLAR